MIDYELCSAGVDNLRIRIVQFAANEHRRLLRDYCGDRETGWRISDIERFLRAGWGQLLSGGNGEYIIQRNRQIVNERRMRK